MSNNNMFTDAAAGRGNSGQLAVQQSIHPQNALATSDQQRAIAEVQAALVIAQSRPRNELQARDRLIKACQRQGLASSAIYTFPRGGQSVTGPSIRLAEVAARCWGNMTYGMRELSRADGESEVEAYAWDLETNTKVVRQFAVRHVRDKKTGNVRLTDERDIYEMIANQGQRRVRAVILEIIPGDIIEEAVDECNKTMQAALPRGTDMVKGIKDMLFAFKPLGVGKEAIEKRLGHKLTPEATQPSEYMALLKIYTSINDGFSRPDEWFDLEADKANGDLNDKLSKAAKASGKDKQQSHPPAQEAPPAQEPPAKEVKEEAQAAEGVHRFECAKTDKDGNPVMVSDADCAQCKDRDGCPEYQ